jgi:oligopeptide transport system ATP-binding protein
MKDDVVAIENLSVRYELHGSTFSGRRTYVNALNGVTLSVRKGETLAIVGESGSGKSTLAMAVLGLLRHWTGTISYNFSEKELTSAKERKMRRSELLEIWRRSSIVFQDPYSALDSKKLVRDIITEPYLGHRLGAKSESQVLASELIMQVGLTEDHLGYYPDQLSGGQRQRIAVARSLINRPELVIFDEPTSSLDVSIQAQILNLLRRLQEKNEMTYLFISHHLSVIRAMCSRVLVMYLGKMVEIAETEELFLHPLHPYTQALVSAIPIPDPLLKRERIIIGGDVPSAASPPSGCRFRTRCEFAEDVCREKEPQLEEWNNTGHLVACHLVHRMDKRIINAAERASVYAGEHADARLHN